MLIEGNNIVREAIIIPIKDIETPLILNGSSSSTTNAPEIVRREEFSFNLPSTNCFEFVSFKSFTC